MISCDDSIDIDWLNAAVAATPFAGNLRLLPTVQSTNTLAMQEAEAGAVHATVYVADEQTAGRGRGAHAWQSPPGTGLYVSILLRPRIAPADVLWLSLAAGLAVREAVLRVASMQADLRWPNDLLLNQRKFCGILTELNAEVTRVRHLVIGIGINVHQEAFPEELQAQATSLYLESQKHYPRQQVLAALLTNISAEVDALTGTDTLADASHSILQRLEHFSSWVRGKPVRVEEGETSYTGVTAGLDDRGFLLVQTRDGLRRVLSGGVREP